MLTVFEAVNNQFEVTKRYYANRAISKSQAKVAVETLRQVLWHMPAQSMTIDQVHEMDSILNALRDYAATCLR